MAVRVASNMDILHHVAGSRPSTALDLVMATSPQKTNPKGSPANPIYLGPIASNVRSPPHDGDKSGPAPPTPGNDPRSSPSSTIPTWAIAVGAGVVLYFLMQ